MKIKRAFTILELLIVMTVISVITGLGIWGLIMFRDNVDIESNYSSVHSYIQTVQNKSVNTTTTGFIPSEFDPRSDNFPSTPTYFGISFIEDTYNLYSCRDSTIDGITCDVTEKNILKSNNVFNTQCPFILFKTGRLSLSSANIVDMTSQRATVSMNNSMESCELTIVKSSSNLKKTLYINFLENSVSHKQV